MRSLVSGRKCVHSHSIWFSFASKTGFYSFRVVPWLRKHTKEINCTVWFSHSPSIFDRSFEMCGGTHEKKTVKFFWFTRSPGIHLYTGEQHIQACVHRSTFHFEQFMINETVTNEQKKSIEHKTTDWQINRNSLYSVWQLFHTRAHQYHIQMMLRMWNPSKIDNIYL